VDESWAIAAEGDGRFSQRVLMASGLVLGAAWTAGTALGVVFGDVLGDPAQLGLDAAFPALFLALLAPQVRDHPRRVYPSIRDAGGRPLAAALLGAGIGLVLTPVAPPGVPIVAAGLACLIGLVPVRRTEP
jgi:predicted branched-subunit amino acid permease